jgi:hypothetical protein
MVASDEGRRESMTPANQGVATGNIGTRRRQ